MNEKQHSVMTHRGLQSMVLTGESDAYGLLMVKFKWDGKGPSRWGTLVVHENGIFTPVRSFSDIESTSKLGRTLRLREAQRITW